MRKEETDIRQLFGSLQFKEQQDFLAYCQDYLDKKQSRYGKTNSLEDWLDDNAGVAGIGAKDANGAEIHEGDILYECSTGTIHTVIWNKRTCAFALRETGFPETWTFPLGIMLKKFDFHVVGNIHYKSKNQ